MHAQYTSGAIRTFSFCVNIVYVYVCVRLLGLHVRPVADRFGAVAPQRSVDVRDEGGITTMVMEGVKQEHEC